MSEQNKVVALRMPLEVYAQGKVEVVDEVIAADFLDHTPAPGVPAGPEGVKLLVASALQAFPDVEITVNHAIAEGDLVVLHVTNSATMEGEFMGMPPSGKHASWDAFHMNRIRDGKIVEHWVIQDQLGMLQQLGFIPPQPGAGGS